MYHHPEPDLLTVCVGVSKLLRMLDEKDFEKAFPVYAAAQATIKTLMDTDECVDAKCVHASILQNFVQAEQAYTAAIDTDEAQRIWESLQPHRIGQPRRLS
jgi:hypothetical protein